jgi:hypothetical protein
MKRKRRPVELRSPISEWEPSKRHLRYLAWIIALGLALAARYRPVGEQAYLTLIAAIVFSVGTVLPQVFRLPYKILLTPLVWLAILALVIAINIGTRSPVPALFRRAASLLHGQPRQQTTVASRS